LGEKSHGATARKGGGLFKERTFKERKREDAIHLGGRHNVHRRVGRIRTEVEAKDNEKQRFDS